MLDRKPHPPKAAPKRARPHEGEAHTELSPRELEQLLLQVARLRAVQARSRSRA
jgi:hypothetical protein